MTPSSAAVVPVILSGGSGTRLWPLSRQSFPKQFTRIAGDHSLFQDAALRVRGAGFGAPLVLTGEPFRFIVTEQLAQIETAAQSVLIEPVGRNTAPAVLAAALWLERQDPGAVLLVVASDHVIPDDAGFRAAVLAAVPRAMAGDLVTFGIAPTRPETGYGYLQPLARFVEKPDPERAAQMLAQGNFLWNSGIFLFSVAAILDAFRAHAPDLLVPVSAALNGAETELGFTRLAAAPWADAENVSIDYAIMEKAANLVAMPYSGGWSDLGGWDAVWRETGPDDRGNVCSPHATAIDCSDTLLRSESGGQEIVGIGLEDIIAIAMPDAVLVARKSESQRVREAVAALSRSGAKQAVAFARDNRPWGWFESLALGDRFQVKRIVVKPGGILSLQSHHHRSEHWIVVEGTARVMIGAEVRLVTENQSVYIPLGEVHRMENPGKLPMVLIEVQTGSYLGEDDIVRYQDAYART
jgi:mannose-1-phosphate guanylyltransferase/mannose-6-phosphate isomerase